MADTYSESKTYKENLISVISKAIQHPRRRKCTTGYKGQHYVCSICEKGFKVKLNLINHVYSHVGYKPYICDFCNKCFTASALLIRHIRYIHTKEKRYECKECGKKFVENSKLKQHHRVHTGERPYPCPHCSYASKYYPGWKRHVFSHTGAKPYPCDICGKRFTVKHSMLLHRIVHTGDKKSVPCKFCSKSFTREFYQKIHIAHMHSRNKIFSCEICNKKCYDRYTWKAHRKTHKGQKNHRCNLCNRKFSTLKAREQHMNIHTNTHPFKCIYCNQEFRQMQSLKRHQKLYHDSERISSVNLLAVKHSVDGFQCSMCSRVYKRLGNLEKHMFDHGIDKTNFKKPSFQTRIKRSSQTKETKVERPRCLVKRTKISNERTHKRSQPSSILTQMKLRSTIDRFKKRGLLLEETELNSESPDEDESSGIEIDTVDEPASLSTFDDEFKDNRIIGSTDKNDELSHISKDQSGDQKPNHTPGAFSVIEKDLKLESSGIIVKLEYDANIKKEIENNFGFESEDEIEVQSILVKKYDDKCVALGDELKDGLRKIKHEYGIKCN